MKKFPKSFLSSFLLRAKVSCCACGSFLRSKEETLRPNPCFYRVKKFPSQETSGQKFPSQETSSFLRVSCEVSNEARAELLRRWPDELLAVTTGGPTC